MDIIFYHPTFDTQWWIEALRKAIPQARVRAWKSGDNDSADYALVWHPPVEMLAGRDLKAVFALGAGVDSILSKLQAHPEMLNPSVPLFRLEDTGMGEQMQEYAVSQVLHWVEGATEAEVRAFLSERGMPLADTPADHIGTLLLAASWLEDQSTEDESEALETLFSEYLLPWCGAFLGKVEAHATTPFWRTMAPLTRDAISAMWDELEEDSEE